MGACLLIAACSTIKPPKSVDQMLFLVDPAAQAGAPVSSQDVREGHLAPGAETVSVAGVEAQEQNREAVAAARYLGCLVCNIPLPQAPRVDSARLRKFRDYLNSGYVPASFWGATEPPLLVEVLLESMPSGAKLVIAGRPTQHSTIDDLYMLPDDIRRATLEVPGYKPCGLTDAIVPGLQQPNGREALLVRCTLTATQGS
jgi:hypothetical protein